MALYFEILTGEQARRHFSIREGMTIGRRDADLTLQDSKVSGRHASVSARPEGGFVLVDAGSSNGIKIEGRKVAQIELVAGAEFQVGRTFLRIVEMDPADASEIIVEEPQTWQQRIAALALKAMEAARPPKQEVVGFSPPLRFKFIQGVQAGVEWTIGYGPRDVGSGSVDLILDEPGLPSQCFRLIPQGGGVLLRAEGEVEIKLNGRRIESELLNDGDELDIQTTRIKVSLST